MTPEVRVVRGEPDDVELAALVAGLAASTLPATPHEPAPAPDTDAVRRWRTAGSPLRTPLSTGADAWRWSTRV